MVTRANMNNEIERAVIGTLILKPGLVDEFRDEITPNDFADPKRRAVCKAMLEAPANYNETVIAGILARSGDLEPVGGVAALSEFQTYAVMRPEFETHLQLLRDEAVRRRAFKLGREFMLSAKEGVDLDILREREKEICLALETGSSDEEPSSARTLAQIIDRMNKRQALPRVSSGYRSLDDLHVEFGDGELICIASRPRTGKSAFALNVCANAARAFIAQGKTAEPILFFSLEMSSEENHRRLLSLVSGVEARKIGFEPGELSREERAAILSASAEISTWNIRVYDDVNALPKMSSIARRTKRKSGLAMVVIDYLQLVTPTKASNREQEVAAISRGCKQLARELKVPVLLLAQLNREIEKRTNPAPLLSDLRESGAIEQDADKVIFLHRPALFTDEPEKILKCAIRNKKAPPDADLKWLERLAVIYCRKNRQFRESEATLEWRGEYLRFCETAATEKGDNQ